MINRRHFLGSTAGLLVDAAESIPQIKASHDAALAVLKPSEKVLQHGLELHAQSLVVESYGFSPRSAIDGAGLRRAIEAGAGALELDDLNTEMLLMRVADDPSHPLPCERVFHYLHPGVGHRNVLLVPFAGGWRVDLQCRVDDDLDHLATPDGVRSWLVEVLLPGHSLDVTWVSTYRFLQVVAERFTDEHRRVLLAGEAAHLFAPFGARGMNSGIADAVAAARAIHLALQEGDPQSRRRVIDGLSGDRRASALYNRDAAGKALRHMQASDPWIRVTRAVAARLARRSCRVGAWMDSAPYGPRRGRVGMTSAKY